MAVEGKNIAGSANLPGAQPHSEAVCGIVMPISALEDCNEAHWADVLNIISDAIRDAGYKPNIVSNADEVGIIQKRIIQNLYDNEVVVCDVSGKNPNVMFELGIRLAFDKPTIVLKDDRTDYSFDTSPIEHISYPRDLRFTKIVEFKQKLSEKIIATAKASRADPSYSTFLKHFGEFKVASLDQKEVGPQEFILEEVSEIKRSLRRLEMESRHSSVRQNRSRQTGGICLQNRDDGSSSKIKHIAINHPAVRGAILRDVGDHKHLLLDIDPEFAANGHDVSGEVRRMIDVEFPR